MAPPVRKRARVDGDYSWIGTSVQTIDDIKPEHCLRAAGLHGSTPCPLISTGIGPDDKASAGSSSRASSRPHPDAGRESSRSESVELIEDPDDKDWGNGQSSRSNGKNGASKPRVYGKKGKGKTTMSENDKRAAALKQIGCSAIGCRGNPQCYNHLGIHQVSGVPYVIGAAFSYLEAAINVIVVADSTRPSAASLKRRRWRRWVMVLV